MKNWQLSLVFALIHVGSLNFLYAQIASRVLGSPDVIVYDVKLVPGSNNLVANLGDNIQVWDYKTGVMITSWSSLQTGAISCFNNKVAGVTKSGNVIVWDLSDGKELLVSKIAESPLLCVAWLDGQHVVVGADNGDLVKINIDTRQQELRANNSAAITALSGRDNVLLSGDAKGNVSIYDAKDLKLKTTLAAHKSWIRDMTLSTTRQDFVTTSDDGTYKIWRIGHGDENMGKHSLGGWVLCTDGISSLTENVNFFAFGTSKGRVVVDVKVARYSAKLNSMINSVAIIESQLPQIVVALGTHGQGIQLLNAKDMKLDKH